MCSRPISFPRIAPRYFIVFSFVKVVPFSISVASEVKGGFPLMVQLVFDALKFSPFASTLVRADIDHDLKPCYGGAC